MATRTAPAADQKLPPNLQPLWKSLLNHYEHKEYVLASQFASQILAKVPTHAETMALKAILATHGYGLPASADSGDAAVKVSDTPLSKKDKLKMKQNANDSQAAGSCLVRADGSAASREEAKQHGHDLIKAALMACKFSSSLCWHVFAMIHKADRNYDEAAKALTQALRVQPDAPNLLRELSMLHLLRRDSNAYVESTLKMLTLRPGQKENWLAFAVAHYRARNTIPAVAVIDIYVDAFGAGDAEFSPYELSELRLFQAHALAASADAGQRGEALLAHLNKYEKCLLDSVAATKLRCEALTHLNRSSESSTLLKKLVLRNPEDGDAIARYLRSTFPIDSEDYQRVPCHYTPPAPAERQLRTGVRWTPLTGFKLRQSFPALAATLLQRLDELAVGLGDTPSDVLTAMSLDLCGPDNFARFEGYILKALKSGAPWLSARLRRYLVPKFELVGPIEELLRAVSASVDSEGVLPNGSPARPHVSLWAKITLSHVLRNTGQLGSALQAAQGAIAHTPTCEMAHVAAAKIYVAVGRSSDATVHHAEIARRLDLSDRYLNNTSAKLHLRVGQQMDADEIMALLDFQHSADSKEHPFTAPLELQMMWYEIADGDCYFANGDYDVALQRYLLVDKHFRDHVEEYSDSHAWSMRKATIRSALSMQDYLSTLWAHPQWIRAATRALLVVVVASKAGVAGRTIPPSRTRFRGVRALRDKSILPPEPYNLTLDADKAEEARRMAEAAEELETGVFGPESIAAAQQTEWNRICFEMNVPFASSLNPSSPVLLSVAKRLLAYASLSESVSAYFACAQYFFLLNKNFVALQALVQADALLDRLDSTGVEVRLDKTLRSFPLFDTPYQWRGTVRCPRVYMRIHLDVIKTRLAQTSYPAAVSAAYSKSLDSLIAKYKE